MIRDSEDWYKYRIVDVCEYIHGAYTGAGDCDISTLFEQADWLRDRYNSWTECPTTLDYDSLIRDLALWSLTEFDELLAGLQEKYRDGILHS